MVAACAETDATNVSAAAIGSINLGVMEGSLLQAGGDVFGMLLVALENLETSLQQALQLRLVRGWNKRCLQRAIDCLVIGDFVGDIGLVEFRALEPAELSEFVSAILRQGLAGVVVFGCDLELLHWESFSIRARVACSNSDTDCISTLE